MPLLLLVLVAVSAGLGSGLAAWRYPRLSAGSSAPAFTAARKVGESAAAHSRFRRTLVLRLDASAATGLALTLALLLTIVGGLGLGALAYLERTNGHLNRVDRSVAAWGNAHATAFSTHGLDVVTQLGAITGAVLVLAVVLAVAETIRTRSAWIVPFLLVLLAGEEILMNGVKILADRPRPTFNPAAAGLGPSFPSGHSATAAAFYAGAALLLSRRRGHVARTVFTGIAVGVAVAVASSRVLLDVHWLSDVIAGLLLGWSWFAVCGIAFGGRLLQFGAPAELAAAVAQDDTSSVRVAHAANDQRREYATAPRGKGSRRPAPALGSVRPVRDGHGFQPRVGAGGAQHVPDVVAHRLLAQVQLLGDLRRRSAAFEKLEHLGLTRCEVQVGVCMRLFDEIGDLPEHADHVLATEHGHRAHLDSQSSAVRVDDRNAGVRDPLRADHLRANSSRARRVSSGATTVVN